MAAVSPHSPPPEQTRFRENKTCCQNVEQLSASSLGYLGFFYNLVPAECLKDTKTFFEEWKPDQSSSSR